jgi:HPt (histidine-containing phosphotransfer) domain-containing protein
MTDDLAVLDHTILDELRASVGGDEDFVRDLVQTYLEEGPQYMEQIAAAAGSGDAEAIVRPAHTLKSSSAALGAARMSAISKQIEFAGREARVGDLAPLAEQANQAWSATVVALKAAGLTS